ncbi:carbohydrate-binding module family 1 protein [Gonapodya prolifera JEL478]|uniref:AA9 family lytic polysaccharide monooxygenase n=1 Tax=Gonapodya prolifera (strain JEL478) TaxID=1344416 RepID=A0A139ATL7_GONPJ|nr:carbohydrate-binding module family 1 protein [Gonapodya prolifera JEL478]|eukprot:KXS20077.1 carbohydrate-binding module family 1 protein [Gonapodya prolifera JEL478]
MKSIIVLLFLSALVSTSLAHSLLYYANTPTQQKVKCVRKMVPFQTNSPVSDLNSSDMQCGPGPTTAAEDVCVIGAGEIIDLAWGHNGADTADGVDPSHMGPCEIYMQKTSGPHAAPTKDGWFKVWEETWTSQRGWCFPSINGAAKGHIQIPLPAGLPSGYYVLRSEMLALHGAGSPGGAQFYIGCLDIQVTGGPATADIAPFVSIPGYLTDATPGVVYYLWWGHGDNNRANGTDYPNPFGPAVANIAKDTSGKRPGDTFTPAPPPTSPAPTPAAPAPAAPSPAAPSPAAPSPASPPTAPAPPTTGASPTIPSPAGPGTFTWNPLAQGCWVTNAVAAQSLGVPSPAAPTPAAASCAAQWEQCGGIGWKGATCCKTGTCTSLNAYYFQCL